MRPRITSVVAFYLVLWTAACGSSERSPTSQASIPTPRETATRIVTATSTATALVLPSATLAPTQSATASATATATAVARATSSASSDEQEMYTLINLARARAGAPIVAADPTLQAIAQTRSRDMLARHFFAHTDPVTNEPLAQILLRRLGLNIPYGENIFFSAAYDAAFADEAMQWLMADAPHRDNILRADWTDVGVGVASDGQTTIATQIFGVK